MCVCVCVCVRAKNGSGLKNVDLNFQYQINNSILVCMLWMKSSKLVNSMLHISADVSSLELPTVFIYNKFPENYIKL